MSHRHARSILVIIGEHLDMTISVRLRNIVQHCQAATTNISIGIQRLLHFFSEYAYTYVIVVNSVHEVGTHLPSVAVAELFGRDDVASCEDGEPVQHPVCLHLSVRERR